MNYDAAIRWLKEYEKSPEYLRNKRHREEREANEAKSSST